jgi:hypothetical protein
MELTESENTVSADGKWVVLLGPGQGASCIQAVVISLALCKPTFNDLIDPVVYFLM